MNWAQFKNPVSQMCLADVMIASWSPTQEVAGSSPFTVMTNISNSVKTFRKATFSLSYDLLTNCPLLEINKC